MLNNYYSLLDKIYKKNRKLGDQAHKVFKVLVNIIYPVYCKLTTSGYALDDKSDIIISLTSYPARISEVNLTIESLMRQSIKPKKIILWLADSQFNGLNDLPEKLIAMKKRGLEIRFCPDLRSHKKYYYAFKEYGTQYPIITVDDDAFYAENMIEMLINKHRQFPKAVCCNWYHTIKLRKNGEIDSYNKWTLYDAVENNPSLKLVPIGVGGVLYPPNCANEMIFNLELIKQLCPNADDLWLKAMTVINGYKAIPVSHYPIFTFINSSIQNDALTNLNVVNGLNDVQMENIAKYFPEVLKCLNETE